MASTGTRLTTAHPRSRWLAALTLLLYCGFGLALQIPSEDHFRIALNGAWSVYVDPSGSADLQQIRERRHQFTPQDQFRPPLAPLQTFWLRLTLENPSARSRTFWLELDSAQARDAHLHIISGPYIKTLGLSPSGAGGNEGRLPGMDFPIKLAANASAELYLRVSRPWQTGFDATLEDSWSHQQSTNRRLFVAGASLGGLLVLLLSLFFGAAHAGSPRPPLALVIVTGLLYAATQQGWLLLLAPVNDSRSGLLQLAPLFCQASFLVALLLYSRTVWPPQASPGAINVSRWCAIATSVGLLLITAIDFGLGFYGLAIMECLTLLLLVVYFVARLLAGERRMLLLIAGLLFYGAIAWPQLLERIAPMTGVYPPAAFQLSFAASSLPGVAVLGLALLFALGQERVQRIKPLAVAEDTIEPEPEPTPLPSPAEPKNVSARPEWWRLLEASFDGILVCELGRVLFCNQAAERLLGRHSDEIVGKPLSLVLGSGSDSDSLLRASIKKPIHFPRAEGSAEEGLELSSRRYLVDHRALTLVSLRASLPGGKGSQVDGLTGLPDLQLLHDRFQELDEATVHAVLLVKLDQMAALQRRYGRQRCNQLIKAMASRISRAVPSQTMMSRWGDQQFVMLLTNIDGKEVATAMADTLRKLVQQPLTIDQREMQTSASIGIALHPDHGKTLEVLMELAQEAAAVAQQLGGDGYQIHDAALAPIGSPSERSKRVFVTSFQEAQRKRSFSLSEKPILAIPQMTAAGLRLLPCWPDLPGQYRNTSQIFALASQTGIAKSLSEQLLRDGIRFGARAGSELPGPIRIRVTPEHLQTPRFVESASSLIASSGARADRFLISFDEPGLLAGIEFSRPRLSQLRQLGFTLGIDNFSDSSRAFDLLRSELFNEVGLSVTWLKSIGTQKRDLQKLATLVKLCHSLELRVRVDQASTEQHLKLATMLACDYASGSIVDRIMAGEGPAP